MNGQPVPSRLARLAMGSAAVVVVLAGMKAAAAIVAPTLFALVITTLLAPALAWLRGRGLPNGLAILVLVLATFIAGITLIGVLYTSAEQMLRTLPAYQQRFEFQADALVTWLEARGVALEGVRPEASSLGRVLLTGAGAVIGGLLNSLSGAVLVLALVLFALMSASALPERLRRTHAGATGVLAQFADFSAGVRSSLWGMALSNLLSASAFTLWFLFWGIDFAVFWGSLAFFLGFIPTIGLFIAAIPPVLLAIVQYGLGTAVWVAAGITVINMVFDQITKKIMGAQVNLSDLAVFLGFLLWTWVFGAIGALIAVPLTLVVRQLLASDDQTRWLATLMEAHDAPASSGEPGAGREPPAHDRAAA